ncbi:MAG: metallophosphoesterase family protein [Pseudomonadota bacterium]
MILAVVSDIHGNSSALDAVLSDVARRGISDIVNLGDALSGPLDPQGTAERLIDLGLPSVMGNHDRFLLEHGPETMGLWERWTHPFLAEAATEWLRRIPRTRVFKEALLCHGTPDSDVTNWLDDRGADRRMHFRPMDQIERLAAGAAEPLILCGHTHIPRMVRLTSGQVVVNPGSVGCPAYLDDREAEPFVAETGAPDARYAICEKTEHGWSVSLVAVPYDPAPMVARALEKGAESWAQALWTGWFTPVKG